MRKEGTGEGVEGFGESGGWGGVKVPACLLLLRPGSSVHSLLSTLRKREIQILQSI